MQHRMTSAASPLVAFRRYDAPAVLLDLATEGATDPPRSGPRFSLPMRQRRAPLDARAIWLASAAPPPERTSAPARAGKDALPCSLSQRCQGIPHPGRPESVPLATLDLALLTARREIAVALAGIAPAVVDPPG